MVDSALDKTPNFYVRTGYLCRSNRRSGLNARIAAKALVGAVEEVKLESYSGFFSPLNPYAYESHSLNDSAIGKTVESYSSCVHQCFFWVWDFFFLNLPFAWMEGLVELMLQEWLHSSSSACIQRAAVLILG